MASEFFCKMGNGYDGHLLNAKYERKSSSLVTGNSNNRFLGEVIPDNELIYHDELRDQRENNHQDKNAYLPILHRLFLSETSNTKSKERHYRNKIPGL